MTRHDLARAAVIAAIASLVACVAVQKTATVCDDLNGADCGNHTLPVHVDNGS